MSKTLWISWTIARRSRELAPEFGARFYEFSWHKIPSFRYPMAFTATLAVILWHRPRVVFAQNPSIFCSALVVLLSKALRFRAVVDSHTVVLPIEGPIGRIFKTLTRFIECGAFLNIVTNRYLAGGIERRGGRAAILPDVIPPVTPTRKATLPGRKNIVYICSFATDEPYREVIEAARLLPPDIHVTITGNYRRASGLQPESLPANASLTGFLSDQEYTNTLCAADVAVVLTSVENCMLCGAYEAISAAKPLILSDTIVLREYFGPDVLYVQNTPEAISSAVRQALEEQDRLAPKIGALRADLDKKWRQLKSEVTRLIK